MGTPRTHPYAHALTRLRPATCPSTKENRHPDITRFWGARSTHHAPVVAELPGCGLGEPGPGALVDLEHIEGMRRGTRG